MCFKLINWCHFISVAVNAKTILKMSKKQELPMVGFPVKSLGDWQRILIHAGFQLAITNQCGKNNPK